MRNEFSGRKGAGVEDVRTERGRTQNRGGGEEGKCTCGIIYYNFRAGPCPGGGLCIPVPAWVWCRPRHPDGVKVAAAGMKSGHLVGGSRYEGITNVLPEVAQNYLNSLIFCYLRPKRSNPNRVLFGLLKRKVVCMPPLFLHSLYERGGNWRFLCRAFDAQPHRQPFVLSKPSFRPFSLFCSDFDKQFNSNPVFF